MTAEVNLAGASFHSEIEWRKAHRTVRRLQVRSAIRSLETAFQDGG